MGNGSSRRIPSPADPEPEIQAPPEVIISPVISSQDIEIEIEEEVGVEPSPEPAPVPLVPKNRNLTPWIVASDFPNRTHWFEKGDLIEFYRKGCLFNHWGIYVGEGKIAHVTSRDVLDSSNTILKAAASVTAFVPAFCRNPSYGYAINASAVAVTLADGMIEPAPPNDGTEPKWIVRKDDITLVAGSDHFRIHNYIPRGTKFAVRTWEEIEAILVNWIGQPFDYSLIRANCTHFAAGLRYVYVNKIG